MRAVVYTETGDSSVLEVVEREAADPGPGEVRVRIVRAGVNPTDWKFRAGGMGELAFPEVVPGQDGAGVVDAVGPDVDGPRGGRPGLDDARRSTGAPAAPRRSSSSLPAGHLTGCPRGRRTTWAPRSASRRSPPTGP